MDTDIKLNTQQLLDFCLHCDFPAAIDVLVEKSAAPAIDLRKAVSSLYTKSDISIYWNPGIEKAGMYLRPHFNQQEFNWGKQLLIEKIGKDRVYEDPLTPYDLQDWWVKVAYSPTIRRTGELLQFFPSKDIPGFGGRPIAATIASGLLGAGLGYGAGYLGEQLLPAWAQTEGTLRKRLALLGGLGGATVGAMPGFVNWHEGRDFNDPTLWSGSPDDLWEKELATSRYKKATDLFVTKKADMGTFATPTSMSPYAWNLTSILNSPPININSLGNLLQQNNAGPQSTAMTMGSVYGASQMPDASNNMPGQVTPHQTGLFGMAMGAAGGGLKGYLTGRAVGAGLGILTGMPAGTQNKLGETGAVMGIVNSFIPKLFN